MIVELYECDKCKKRSENQSELIKAFGMVDLCAECFEKAVDNFNRWLAEDEAKKPAEKENKKRGRVPKNQIPVDWDKACALKEAGWSPKAIAEELGVSEASIKSGKFYDKYKGYLQGKRENRRTFYDM